LADSITGVVAAIAAYPIRSASNQSTFSSRSGETASVKMVASVVIDVLVPS
jgi:hypothetical protein